MALRRYQNVPKVKGGLQYGTSRKMSNLYFAVARGQIASNVIVSKGLERLDAMAGRIYGNSKLLWVIAAASGIGWNLQVPAGTRIVIPKNLADVSAIVG